MAKPLPRHGERVYADTGERDAAIELTNATVAGLERELSVLRQQFSDYVEDNKSRLATLERIDRKMIKLFGTNGDYGEHHALMDRLESIEKKISQPAPWTDFHKWAAGIAATCLVGSVIAILSWINHDTERQAIQDQMLLEQGDVIHKLSNTQVTKDYLDQRLAEHNIFMVEEFKKAKDKH